MFPGPTPPRAPADLDFGLGLDSPRQLPAARRFGHEAMHTLFEIYAAHDDPQYSAQAAQAAFDLVDRLERDLSRFIHNSDVFRINQLAAGESTQVSSTTLECLVIARHVFELTGGAFDIAIGTGLRALVLDADTHRVTATTSGVRIDLGAIGKGYAIDLAAEVLEEWGVGSALVHGGFSSVLALDPPPGCEGWPLTLSDPAAPSRVLERISARQVALGASGVRKKDHIRDPRTGEPVRGRLATWAVVPRPERGPRGEEPRMAACAVADAVTTALMMLAPETIEMLCAETPGLQAWVLLEPAAGQGSAPELLRFGSE